MRVKSCPVRIKAAGEQDGTADGVFEAIVAAYNVDTYGDKIIPGAFADTLAEWKSSGNPIPVLWSHMSHDPDMHLGVVEAAEERDEGLWVRARMDLDAPKAAQVYRLLKGRRVTQFSFAYDIDDGDRVEDDVYELRKLRLYEVGPTLIGVNQQTQLLEVKGQQPTVTLHVTQLSDRMRPVDQKAGRTLSAKNEGRLRDAAVLITEVLDSITESGDDDSKATPTPPAPSEEPQVAPGAKDVVPTRPGTASIRLLTDLAALEAAM